MTFQKNDPRINTAGKPKGAKNKTTLERERREIDAAALRAIIADPAFPLDVRKAAAARFLGVGNE